MLRELLARLVDGEVRRLRAQLDQARADRDRAAKAAVRHHIESVTHQARADALAAMNVGRCGNRLTAGFGNPANCALPAGHAGWHRADNGVTEWGPITNTEEK
ncbi:hypothetical protein [Micromonospora sp. NPDC023633]|uniref:hypothetical protein n=1 Tax=Micromonospora sp. NPDC023633 TaxID=3154320 RepID=UPI0033D4C012